MRKKTIRDVNLGGRKVLMRVDFNVPISRDGDIADDTRIKAALPSIGHVTGQGASVVLMSHLGRPGGERVPSFSLKVVAYRLAELVSNPVKFVEDCIGDEVARKAAALSPGEILLLENLRFHREETDNDPVFSEQLAGLGDLYVNDAFGTAHRSHASTEGVTRFFEERVAGFLMEQELEVLGGLLGEPRHPFVAVLGGAKISGKIGLIKNLLNRVDRIVIGGGMAFTFLKAAGLEIGRSLVDDDLVPLCRELMGVAGRGDRKQIFLPIDCVVARGRDDDTDCRTVSTGDIPEDWVGVDIGDGTVEIFGKELRGAKTVFWNGPMGIFEMPSFAAGTNKIARIIAEVTDGGASSVIGGGDSVAALNQLNLIDKITHVSTGGGASLELLEGKKLPGIEALSDRD